MLSLSGCGECGLGQGWGVLGVKGVGLVVGGVVVEGEREWGRMDCVVCWVRSGGQEEEEEEGVGQAWEGGVEGREGVG